MEQKKLRMQELVELLNKCSVSLEEECGFLENAIADIFN